MVDNVYLKNVLSKCNPEVVVTSVDRLSETECQNSKYFIINTADFPYSGHWIGLILSGNVCTYFDSLGLESLIDERIVNFICKRATILKYNISVIQSPLSEYCGFFCIGFILSFMCGENLGKYLDRFSDNDLIKNDSIVIRVICFYSKMMKCV